MTPVLKSESGTLKIDQSPLLEEVLAVTTITADASSGSGTITVKSIKEFSTDDILLLGEIGQDDAEIIKTHGSTSPSGTTITLASNTVFAHSAGTKVYQIQFDQVELSHASTLTGSKSVLSTAALFPRS